MATPAQVLQDVRFAERLAEIEARVAPALAKAQAEPTLARRNQVRRQLYRDSELLRVELEEKMNELGIEKLWLTAPEMVEANAKLDAVRKQLRLEMLPASKSLFETAYMGVRLATLVLLLVGWFSAITLLIPLKLLNPVLEQLGVKKNYFPMDVISWMMANLLCIASCADFTAEGTDNIRGLSDAIVCMFSHASNLDGFIANAASPTALRFAAKKSLFMIPCLGWAARWGFDFVAIDRGNRSSALKSLKHMAYSVNVRGFSVCISPEGTRSKDGLLQEFKKGPFYLREDINKNVIPALVFGAYELWPPGRLFALPGKTLIRFLPEFKVDPSKNRNQNRLALRRIFLEAFTEDVPDDIGTHVDLNALLKNMASIYLIWAVTFKFTSIAMGVIGSVCYWLNISYWTFAKLSLLVAAGGEALMFFSC